MTTTTTTTSTVSVTTMRLMVALLSATAIGTSAFVPTASNNIGSLQVSRRTFVPTSTCCSAKPKKDDDDDDEDETKSAMEDAFARLESIGSLDDGQDLSSKKKDKLDESFANAVKDLDIASLIPNEDADDSVGKGGSSLEQELKVYQDMVAESETGKLDEVGEILKSELIKETSTATSGTGFAVSQDKLDSIPTLDPTKQESLADTDAFMKKALEQALEEAKTKAGSDIEMSADTIIDDSMKKDIEKIFNKANDKLKASLEEIREEQRLFAEKSTEESSRKSAAATEDEERRLEVAQANMKKMLQKVNDETQAVEKAIEDLKRAQSEAESKSSVPNEKFLIDMKNGGIVKQGALVGAFLFATRSFSEIVAYTSDAGDSHLFPAILQAALAVACAAILKLL